MTSEAPAPRRGEAATSPAEQTTPGRVGWHRHHNGVVCREDKCRMLPAVVTVFGVEDFPPPPCGDPYPHSHPHGCKATP